MKKCTKCGHLKSTDEFYKRASTKDGLQFYCKDCKRARQRQWASDNAEHLRAYKEGYYAGGRRINPMTETPSYGGVHLRIRATNGPASTYSCVDCGGEAREWAYSNICPEEMTGRSSRGTTVRYCVHVECYRPMCCKCHRAFDKV